MTRLQLPMACTATFAGMHVGGRPWTSHYTRVHYGPGALVRGSGVQLLSTTNSSGHRYLIVR
jgi:hypothetical protein